MALDVASVEQHKVKIASDDNNSHSAFSIKWKIVKLFVASMKNAQNEFSVKLRKIVAEMNRNEMLLCIILHIRLSEINLSLNYYHFTSVKQFKSIIKFYELFNMENYFVMHFHFVQYLLKAELNSVENDSFNREIICSISS